MPTPAVAQSLTWRAGDPARVTVRVVDADGVPVSLAGSTWTAQVRQDRERDVLATMTTDAADAAGGVLSFFLTGVQTRAIRDAGGSSPHIDVEGSAHGTLVAMRAVIERDVTRVPDGSGGIVEPTGGLGDVLDLLLTGTTVEVVAQSVVAFANAVDSVDGRTGAVSLSDLYDAAGSAAAAEVAANTYTDTAVDNATSSAGLLAERPAASGDNAGHFYFATDVDGGTLYRSNGTSWVQAGASVNATASGEFVPQVGGRVETLVVEAPSGAAYEFDLFNGNAFDLTLTADCTVTIANYAGGETTKGSFDVLLRQDATGTRTVTWPATVEWPADTAPTLSTDGSDLLRFHTFDAGVTWIGEVVAAGLSIDSAGENTSPDSISGLAAWFNANALGLANGASVSTWTDEASTHDLIQATGSRQPEFVTGVLNGLPIVRFDDMTADFMDTASGDEWVDPSAGFTFFIVCAQTEGAGDRSWVRQEGTGGQPWLEYVQSTDRVRSNLGGTALADASAHTSATFQLWGLRYGSGTLEMFRGGTVVASAARTVVTATDKMRIGANSGGGGVGSLDIAEMIAYSRPLTDTEVGNIESYVTNKYGLTLA